MSKYIIQDGTTNSKLNYSENCIFRKITIFFPSEWKISHKNSQYKNHVENYKMKNFMVENFNFNLNDELGKILSKMENKHIIVHDSVKLSFTTVRYDKYTLRNKLSNTARENLEKYPNVYVYFFLYNSPYIIVNEIDCCYASNIYFISELLQKKVKVYFTKSKFEIDNSISSQAMIFAFSLTVQIERELISQRTKDALVKKKKDGQILGRPKNKMVPIEIKKLLVEGVNINKIAEKYDMARATISKLIKKNNFKENNKN